MDSNKMKKSVRCPPDYLYATSSSSAASGMGVVEGKPPDRGPTDKAVPGNISKRSSKPSSGTGGVGRPSSSVVTPPSASTLNSDKLSQLSKIIQKVVLQLPRNQYLAEQKKLAKDGKLPKSKKKLPTPMPVNTNTTFSWNQFPPDHPLSPEGFKTMSKLTNPRRTETVTSQDSLNLTEVRIVPHPIKTTAQSDNPATFSSSNANNTGTVSSLNLRNTARASSSNAKNTASSSNARNTATASSSNATTSQVPISNSTFQRKLLEPFGSRTKPSSTVTCGAPVKNKSHCTGKRRSALHWEVMSERHSTVFDDTIQFMDRNHKHSNLNKPAATRKWTSEPASGMSAISVPVKNQTLKRKSEVLLKSNSAKRRKLGLARSVRGVHSVSKQYQHLLASVLLKCKSTSSKIQQPFSSLMSSSVVPSGLPPPNSLLMKYDPIKILNRPCLLATFKSSQSNIGTPATSLSRLDSHLPLTSYKSTGLNQGASGSRSSQQISGSNNQLVLRSSTVQIQTQPNSSPQKIQPLENAIMPPPKFPPPWSQNKRNDGRSRVPHGSHASGHPLTSFSGSTLPVRKSQPLSTKLPNLLSKLSLTKPSNTSQRRFEMIYEADKPNISESQLRIATVAAVRNAVRKNRIQQSIGKHKLRTTIHRPVHPTSTEEGLIKSKLAITTFSAQANSSQLVPYKSITAERTDSLALIKTGDSEQKTPQLLWRKNASVITTIQENPLIDHAIELLRDKRELQKRLELVEDEGIIFKLKPLPKLRMPIAKAPLLHDNIPLTASQTKSILQKRLTIVLAHQGFTHTNLQPLEVLADVIENFFKKTAHRLKQVAEMEMSGCEQEFPDPMERVMMEMGLGGVRGVEEFYKTRIVDYRKKLEEQCTAVRNEYSKKVRLKVGKVSISGGCNSSSSSTSISGQPLSPGNSVLAEILSGVEEKTASSHLCIENRPTVQQNRLLFLNAKQSHQHQSPTSATTQRFPLPSSSLSRPPSRSPTVLTNPKGQSPALVANQNPNSSFHQLHSNSHLSSMTPRSGKPKAVTIMQGGGSTSTNTPISNSSSMVSINLNNNLDLGGFTGIPNSGSNAPISGSSANRNVITSNSNSKAKLKEALSQRNLLRLNFEQAPSSCDSTVLLSSSSPSLSKANSCTPAKK